LLVAVAYRVKVFSVCLLSDIRFGGSEEAPQLAVYNGQYC
jgi:hypothetical protein